MKKFIMALVCLMTMVIGFTSCNEDPKEKIQSNLEDVVIEKGMGFINKCKTISIEIDSVRVSDIKSFIAKIFPNGEVPNDFNDERFDKYILPIKNKINDDDIVYLSVTHKYKIYMSNDPFKRSEVIVTANRLVNPQTYEYVDDDLSKDDSWLITPTEYMQSKLMEWELE